MHSSVYSISSSRVRALASIVCLSFVALLSGCGGAAAGAPSGGSASGGTGSTTPTLQSISVSAAASSVTVGATDQFTAAAKYSDGSTKDVTGQASWSDSNTKVATINAAGLATATGAGSTTVTATYNGLTSGTTMTVPQPVKTITSITVTPASTGILVGASQALTATATYNDSSTANISATVTWTSSNPAIATVSASGAAMGVAPGNVTITASVSGVSGAAALSVASPQKTLSAITVTAASSSFAAGTTDQLAATAKYSDGSTANVTSSVTWMSSSASVLTVSASGVATGVTGGTANVTASLSGVTGSLTLTVTRTLKSITVTPAAPTLGVGGTQQFTATAGYSDGSTQNVTASATWSSSSVKIVTVTSAGIGTAVAPGTATVTATFNNVSGTDMVTVNAFTLTISPASPSFAMDSTQQFTASLSNGTGTAQDVTAQATWSVANTDVATIASGGLATGVAAGYSTVSASYEGVTASEAITVTLPTGSGVSIPTWHVDAYRSGLNSREVALTPANVAPASFGKLFSYLVDGYAFAEPLIMSNVTINGTAHNVLYVATENDTVYAFDADNYGTGAPLWKTSLLQSGETPLQDGPIQPNQGITGTPVIDPTTNTLYVVSAEKSAASGSGYRLNALDIATGAQKSGSPVAIKASVAGSNATAVNGQVPLPGGCIQRTALLLANGNIYMGIGSCHEGWVLAYNASSLAQVAVFNVSPNLDGEGQYASAGGVWMGSGGPVADSAGNIYVSTGNGPWNPSQSAYSDSVLKFDKNLNLLDYFTPQDYAYMFCADSDLASGGLMMIPGSGQIIGGGKMGKLYLLNTANLGHEQANDAGATQTIFAEQGVASPYQSTCSDSAGSHTAMINSYEIFGTPAFFNGSLYVGVTPTSTSPFGVVHRFGYSSGVLSAQESSSPSVQQNTRGTTPFISANGTTDGIVWMIDEGQPINAPDAPTTATLRAYDAQNLANQIYNSSTNTSDEPGYGIKFSSPVVANGKVYISTGNPTPGSSGSLGEINVYGLK